MPKRTISILLSLLLVFSLSITAFSEQEEPVTEYYYYNNDELKCSVLIISYDPQYYSVRGEKPEAVTEADGKTTKIAEDKILFSQDEAVALLYICLDDYINDTDHSSFPEDAVIKISSGAYLTADGKASPEETRRLHFGDWRSRTYDSPYLLFVDGVMPWAFHEAKIPEMAEGAELTVGQQHYTWRYDIVYTDNGEVLPEDANEYTYTPSLGKHVLYAKANEYVYERFEFTVVTKETMRKDHLKLLLKEGFRFGRYIPMGIIGSFIPSAAWGLPAGWAVFAMQAQYFITFARQLFSKEIVDSYNQQPVKRNLLPGWKIL